MLSTHENPLVLALPESVGQKWEAWHDRWLGKQVRSFGWTQLFAYLFADGMRQRWNRRYWRALVAKIHREKVSIDSRVYTGARDFLARDGPWRSFVPNFIGVSSFLPRLIFVWNSFFFSTSIELVYRVWTMFGIVVKEIYFLFFFFFLRDEELRKEIILSSSRTFSFILRFLLWEFNSINFFNEILIFDHISCICCFVEC